MVFLSKRVLWILFPFKNELTSRLVVRQCVRINYMCCSTLEGRESILAYGKFIRYSSQYNFYVYTVTWFIMKIWEPGVLVSEYECKRSHRGKLTDKCFKERTKIPSFELGGGVVRDGQLPCSLQSISSWVWTVTGFDVKLLTVTLQQRALHRIIRWRKKASEVFFFLFPTAVKKYFWLGIGFVHLAGEKGMLHVERGREERRRGAEREGKEEVAGERETHAL